MTDDMQNYPYGLCPAQVDGFTADGRPFYYRCRHEHWTVEVGELGWRANICSWPRGATGTYRDQLVAEGDGDVTAKDEVDALLDRVLGEGWRHAEWQECLYTETCRCGREFQSDGGNVCGPCLTAALGWPTTIGGE